MIESARARCAAPTSFALRSPSPRYCKGGQLVAHFAALLGKPYGGLTLATVIPVIAEQIGVSLTRVFADAGYRGHNAPHSPGLRVYTSGQKRGVTEQIKRELR